MYFYMKALGCRLNEAELQSWSQQFINAGYQLATSAEVADVLVLNTCAVTSEASRKSRQLIRRLHRENPRAKIIVTGCYASLEVKQVEAILGVDLVVPNDKKDQLVEIINDHFHLKNELLETMPNFATEPGESALFKRNRDRAFIKIQDGCRYRCSYCIVTVARGAERSRSIAEIIEEINHYSEQGIKEIVLTGVHVGGYGSDLDITLMQLVEAILADTDIPRVRFASVEPWDLPENFFRLFENKRLMPHMHLPLQSGSDAVLKRMSRRCNQKSFIHLMNDARKYVQGFNATTDVIVGFPGETEDEWQESLDFIQQIGFGHIHIFSYSHREGTRAAKLPHQLTTKIKKQRSKVLSDIAHKMKVSALNEMVGQKVDVLWESGFESLGNNRYQFSGYTPNYHRVFAEMDGDGSGLILPVTLESVKLEKAQLIGHIAATNLSAINDVISLKQL